MMTNKIWNILPKLHAQTLTVLKVTQKRFPGRGIETLTQKA